MHTFSLTLALALALSLSSPFTTSPSPIVSQTLSPPPFNITIPHPITLALFIGLVIGLVIGNALTTPSYTTPQYLKENHQQNIKKKNEFLVKTEQISKYTHSNPHDFKEIDHMTIEPEPKQVPMTKCASSMCGCGSVRKSVSSNMEADYVDDYEVDDYKYTHTFKNHDELKKAVKNYPHNINKYGNISYWNVSNVTNMSCIFEHSRLNEDISKWDVSNVETMHCMFQNSNFNRDISNWDVNNVINMKSMFANSCFDGDISNWDVRNVENMEGMFENCKFNRDISNWDVGKVKNMGWMFSVSIFNGDISNWDVSNVIYMNTMFSNSKFNGDISNWDLSNVEYMEYMFHKNIELDYN